MNKIALLILVFINTISYSQLTEGQNFCEESENGEYFPLTIDKKKILWADISYIETKNEVKTIKGKEYIEFKQDWGNDTIDLLYLREENGVIYQYQECCKNETIRYDKKFEKGHSWKTADNSSEYRIISFEGSLKTPYCEYKNLLVIEAKLNYGTFNFYYLKGHGYVGATRNEKIISCVSPR